jgi:hypothetical protein
LLPQAYIAPILIEDINAQELTPKPGTRCQIIDGQDKRGEHAEHGRAGRFTQRSFPLLGRRQLHRLAVRGVEIGAAPRLSPPLPICHANQALGSTDVL